MVERQRKNRQDIVDILGGMCVRCGYDDVRALQIDHVNNNGGRERRIIGYGKITTYMYNKIKLGSKDYQLLCANCNFIKLLESREV